MKAITRPYGEIPHLQPAGADDHMLRPPFRGDTSQLLPSTADWLLSLWTDINQSKATRAAMGSSNDIEPLAPWFDASGNYHGAGA